MKKELLATLENKFKQSVKSVCGITGKMAALVLETFAAMTDNSDGSGNAYKVKEAKAILIQWAVEAGMDIQAARWHVNAALRANGIRQRAPRKDIDEIPEGAKELAAYAVETYGDKARAYMLAAYRSMPKPE